MKRKPIVHFGSMKSGDLKLICGGDLVKLPHTHMWTHKPEDVTCQKCFALMLTNSGRRMVKKTLRAHHLEKEAIGEFAKLVLKSQKKKVTRIAPRNVNCLLCREKMFYNGDPRWEPEFSLDILLNHKFVEGHYVHQRCWNGFNKRSKVK